MGWSLMLTENFVCDTNKEKNMQFEDAVKFHGHACPGLALGFRAAETAQAELGLERARDEELVCIAENRSCAVDAIQVVAGCTAGKGNLFFRDYGKQIYTFLRRDTGQAVRLAVIWQPPAESAEQQVAWQRFSSGDRSPETMRLIRARKAEKIRLIRSLPANELFNISRPQVDLPEVAQVYPSLRCSRCREKVMEPLAKQYGDEILCIPCFQKEEKKEKTT
jgi:formylmethanofuran dehydrogenase subunit E